MRRILVDAARRRNAAKRGGNLDRVEMPDLPLESADGQLDLISLDEALRQLELEHPAKARLIKLRFFAGSSVEQAAEFTGVSRATAQRDLAFARAWLFGKLHPE